MKNTVRYSESITARKENVMSFFIGNAPGRIRAAADFEDFGIRILREKVGRIKRFV